MKKDSLKVCLKKFNIHLHDNLVLSSNLTYNFVKNVQTLNFTQFYLYFNGKFPIISDQIIQFVHQNKSEFDSINIFMSPLDINISFEELPIVYNYFMKIKSKFQNLEKIFCIYFNLTKFSVNFGVKSNNSIYETIKLNSVLSHIKGTLENGQIKYDFTSSLKIIGFSSKFSQFVPIINNLDINFLIFVSKSEINSEIKTNSDLKSILTVEFINLLNNIKDYHDLQSDKKIFIENQSISKIILNNNLNLIINPNQTINYNEKTIQFGSSVPLLPTNMFFDGFQISKNLILQIDSSFEGNYYRILPKMTIHNSLPVSFSVFSANRNLIFNLSPNEEKILETNCFIIAENSSSAKASEKIIINEKRKIFSNLISQNVQKSIVIDISDSSVNVLPRLVVVNEIGHPFFVKLSSANLIIEKKVEERENIMLPYYEQLPIHASINFSDGFSNEFKIGEIFKVKISSEYINIASKLRVNDNGQTEIVFYPQFSFINRGISEIFIHSIERNQN
ncbi:hypothetical protein TVAG_437640 [Trichomonas vaginalis G3]|uniref:Uncharacterized protein n=1 Tax=Trichomonas vaginalis (strain ATCC PRA-98 / G3) TaxID=412133 RepID=A2FWT5_TRIV3|nr:hypothetical protein TVAGG3_0727000 [Trichomonas vaginalis G3]EAX90620.1 hypothetical protein TVAG_437640 [Trichomonas vaginalis G3]KAI5510977.1 hypothetical protein TVAGG3_0727000 [Trichomonas vaginalis G3]|eukprot:XP_001303550.1 hypothetical protein [Trichomonas vaginalis G3]